MIAPNHFYNVLSIWWDMVAVRAPVSAAGSARGLMDEDRRDESVGRRITMATAAAQDAAPRASIEKSKTGGEIMVTGTRTGERTVTTSSVPIDVLRGDELRASGYQETSEVLPQLAPSFSFANPTTPDGNTHIHSASLRGLSPDETLVLVNGKRLHGAAWVNTGGTIGKGATPTDLNQIPAAGIGWTCLGKVESSLEVRGELGDEAAMVHEKV
ncbi:hypothetical protein QE363_002028 [Sphingomonas sp. SORGH_AS870]|uniref:Plug domain-containing protein n=1 Tax=Sphingomonas sp. SORGH_AS_0870 TaxID=3041801 RepID=UPI00286431DC|nr:Plug domain-containing protein [Sphingomonas sp. SORGH_AS_0870]MDR6146235.1 hypothetical protein [Sphingomonas sp. SORGH_AS_0870]